jgi:hypothetical protein
METKRSKELAACGMVTKKKISLIKKLSSGITAAQLPQQEWTPPASLHNAPSEAGEILF